jgi:hypothetical protein
VIGKKFLTSKQRKGEICDLNANVGCLSKNQIFIVSEHRIGLKRQDGCVQIR